MLACQSYNLSIVEIEYVNNPPHNPDALSGLFMVFTNLCFMAMSFYKFFDNCSQII